MKKAIMFFLVALVAMSAAAKKVNCKMYDFNKSKYVTVVLDLNAKEEAEYNKLWADIESLDREYKQAFAMASSYDNQKALGGSLWLGRLEGQFKTARTKLNAFVKRMQ